MKVCVFGNKSLTSRLLEHITQNDFSIDTLVTLSNKNRFKISGSDRDIEQIAKRHNIRVFHVSDYTLEKPEIKKFFEDECFSIGLCVGWQRLIPEYILTCFEYGIFGWHGSGFRFPNGRGRSPLNWTIRLGMKKVYHNFFKYSAGIDDGDVVETETFTIENEDYIKHVQTKALNHINDSACRLLAKIDNNEKIILIKQTKQPFIVFPKLTESSGHLHPNLIYAEEAVNIARSCSRPFPGAFIRLKHRNTLIRLWALEFQPKQEINEESLSIGMVALSNSRNLIRIRCIDSCVYSDEFAIEEASDDKIGSIHDLGKGIFCD